jgi:metallophosphoesterase superfamily enzyme
MGVCVARVILIIKFAARFIVGHSHPYVRLENRAEAKERAFTRNQQPFSRDSRAITSPIRVRSARELRDAFTPAFSLSLALSLSLSLSVCCWQNMRESRALKLINAVCR